MEFCIACQGSPVCCPVELFVEVGELKPLEVPALHLMCDPTESGCCEPGPGTKEDTLAPRSKVNTLDVVGGETEGIQVWEAVCGRDGGRDEGREGGL